MLPEPGDQPTVNGEPEPEFARSPAQVWFLSGDLMFASRVRAAAERAGLEFHLATSLPSSVDGDIQHVILDLSTRSSLAATLVETCAVLCPHAKLVAYGPHVQIGRLKTARDAGIANVMTRGQFDQSLPRLFQDIA